MNVNRILVIEDHPDNRRIMSDVLSHAGYEVTEAADAERAMKTIHAARPDLVVVDVQLPGMDGYQCIGWLRSQPEYKTTPVLVVTSYALAGDEARALAAGGDDYLSKPISPRELVVRVGRLLGKG